MKKLRRNDKAISREEAEKLLVRGEYGVLSTIGEDGQPYGVPLNYVFLGGAIYFHCALTGHKLENIACNPNVSFCVVEDTEILPAEFSTNYKSVIISGEAKESTGEERYAALIGLLEKYSPEFLEEGKAYIQKLDKATKVVKITVQQITGKRAPAPK